MSVTLRQLKYFEAIARHRHLGRAAEECAVTQPALSVQLKELEAALGVPLLDRALRPLRLTPAGVVLAERARKILAEVDALTHHVRAAAARPLDRLRLGVIPTVAPYLLPKVIRVLTEGVPGLQLGLRETLTPKLLNDVLEGRLDAALVALPTGEPALAETALFTEAFLLVRPLADARKPPPDPERLREMRLLLLEEGHCFRDQALAFCTQSGRIKQEILEGTSLATLVQMVAAGLGVTLLPEMAVAIETKAAAVSVIRFPSPEPCRTIGMVWRRESPLAQVLEQLAGLIAALRPPAARGTETPPPKDEMKRLSSSLSQDRVAEPETAERGFAADEVRDGMAR